MLKSNGSTIYWASDANTTPYGIRVYRQTSGYNDDYPLLVSRSLASAITATNGGYLNNIYGIVYNAKIPTLNPSTGMMKVPGGITANLTGNASSATKIAITEQAAPTTATTYRIVQVNGNSGNCDPLVANTLGLWRDSTSNYLVVGNNSLKGGLTLQSGAGSGKYVDIIPGSLTTTRTLTLPDKSGTIALLSDCTDHSHSNYVVKTGDTMTGSLSFGNGARGVRGTGRGSSWFNGRNNALVGITTISGYTPTMTTKTTNGSWEIGAYDSSSYYDSLVFTYITDTNYNSSANNVTAQINFCSDGHIQNYSVRGGSGITGSHEAALEFRSPKTGAAGSWLQGWISGYTQSGAWSIGNLCSENLVFTYGTNTSYINNNNNPSYVQFGSGGQVYGAVWNDYAEYRNVPEAQENCSKASADQTPNELAGRCVCEVGDDTMILSTKRLQKGCKIISDTYGFAIGETEECKTPIAVSGRVLVYPFESKEDFKNHIGDAVCSGPDGTVSIMTDEEVKEYPLSILGTISAVPEYEEWGTNNIKVNNRIWIYVR